MLKRIVLCLFVSSMCVCISFASLSDSVHAKDGLLGPGEYEGGRIKMVHCENLLIQGGGADWIEARDESYIKVDYTSVSSNPAKPVTNSTGIWDIMLYDNSRLLWLDGAIDEITVGHDAVAVLKGGYVGAITLYHFSGWSSKVTIYCQDGYTKDENGISGFWLDGTPFSIDFINVGGVFSPYPTCDYVEVIPEPATLMLIGFGGLLIRRKK